MIPTTSSYPNWATVLIVLGCIGALAALVWIGKVNGDALVGLVSIIVGGVIHANGTKTGAQASSNPASSDSGF